MEENCVAWLDGYCGRRLWRGIVGRMWREIVYRGCKEIAYAGCGGRFCREIMEAGCVRVGREKSSSMILCA